MPLLQVVPPTMLPGPFDTGAAQAFANIGALLGRLVNPQGFRRREIQQEIRSGNVELAQALAAGFRSAEEQAIQSGNLGNANIDVNLFSVLETVGLDPSNEANVEFIRSIVAAFPPTFEEELATQRRRLRTAGQAGRTELAELQGRERVAGPEAEASVAEAEARIGEAGFRRRLFEMMNTLGVPELEAQLEVARRIAEGKGIEFDERMLEGATLFYSRLLRTDPAEAARFVAALRNPEYLRDIQHRERLTLEESLARLRLAQSQAESAADLAKAEFEHLMEVSDNIVDLFQAAQEARESGDRSTVEAAFSSLKNHMEYFEGRWPGAQSISLELGKGRVEGRVAPSKLDQEFEIESFNRFVDAAVNFPGSLREFEQANPEVMKAIQKMDVVGDFRRAVVQETGEKKDNLLTRTQGEITTIIDVAGTVFEGVENFIERGGLLGAVRRAKGRKEAREAAEREGR